MDDSSLLPKIRLALPTTTTHRECCTSSLRVNLFTVASPASNISLTTNSGIGRCAKCPPDSNRSVLCPRNQQYGFGYGQQSAIQGGNASPQPNNQSQPLQRVQKHAHSGQQASHSPKIRSQSPQAHEVRESTSPNLQLCQRAVSFDRVGRPPPAPNAKSNSARQSRGSLTNTTIERQISQSPKHVPLPASTTATSSGYSLR